MDTDKTDTARKTDQAQPERPETDPDIPVEVNGPKGPEPTRYGDWEQKGRCSDF